MHIMEKILGETHFFNVIRDFYKITLFSLKQNFLATITTTAAATQYILSKVELKFLA